MQPIFVATWWFGRLVVNRAWQHWRAGPSPQSDPPASLLLDAVEQGIITAEENRRVDSVGRGGLPNAAGDVELDAAWMDGGRLRVGGVAAMRNYLPAISVARRVMERTPHTLLVGKGAEQFARAQGFRRQPLLTAQSRRRWQRWKQSKSKGVASHDTVGLIGWHNGHVVVGCSTSGTAWKLPGRVGDSPIVGAGLFADDLAGAAVATGLGEEIYRFSLTGRIVEAMRGGASATQACAAAIRFMARRKPETAKAMIAVLAVRKDGTFGMAATRRGFVAYVREGAQIRALRS
jgi:N4-(beta-N-acetylglucosaminyl)-L-asparaginase